ncbi:MAG: winged helix-turn-helix domain-containing protein [Pseudohongiella sp.]|nr:winged helix-turn-helix domain-containing protein [Pseudohongiella sp.]
MTENISSTYDNHPVQIGDWNVSPGACTVSRNGKENKITPRSMDVLRLLINNAGSVVSPSEFLDTIWRSPIATDHAVHKAIAELRSALEDDAHQPRYIKTVPKRGYTLIADVRREQTVAGIKPADQPTIAGAPEIHAGSGRLTVNSSPESWWKRVAIAAVLCALVITVPLMWRSTNSTPEANGVVKLAVLPFSSRDFSDDNQILAEGIRESLIHGLSKIGHLQVLSPASTPGSVSVSRNEERSYLRDADHVLQGSVMISDGRMRVIVHLVRARDGLREYSDQFDMPINDIFAVQDQIVSNVVSALSVYLNDAERSQMMDWGTTNPLAYERFLRGEFYNNQFNPADWERAISYHQAAIELDPNFLNAYHGLATAANNLAVYSGSDTITEMYEIVLDVHREISRINPGSEILNSIEAIKLRMRGSSYIQQEIQLREQIRSGNPPHFAMAHYGLLLIGARMYDEAARFLSQAPEVGPYEISPDEVWSYRINVLTPPETVMARKNQLQKRPFHVSILGSVAVNLAILGDFRQAQIYLNQQREVDSENLLAHYTEVVMGFLSGNIQPGSQEYLAAMREHPDFYYNNGVLAFMAGDIDRGVYYWTNLPSVQLRRLFNVTHSAEKFFPDHVLTSAEYQDVLESLGAGISWQHRLMEGVIQMEQVTGVALSRSARDAYERNEMMMKNNLWSEQQWAEFNHHKTQRINQASTLSAPRIH